MLYLYLKIQKINHLNIFTAIISSNYFIVYSPGIDSMIVPKPLLTFKKSCISKFIGSNVWRKSEKANPALLKIVLPYQKFITIHMPQRGIPKQQKFHTAENENSVLYSRNLFDSKSNLRKIFSAANQI